MKKIINVIVCVFFIIPITALSQNIFSSQKIISDSIDGGCAICSSDLDNDNDLDVISISTQDNILSWYENLDGQGNFGTPNVLSTSMHGGGDVCTADLDNDNDPDIIAASPTNESFQLAWFQNIDNNGTFSEAKTIINNNGHTNSIFPADMDNDGDIDLLLAHTLSFVLFTNINGSGTFDTPKEIYNAPVVAHSIYAADFDLDGYADILVATGNEIAWFQNLTNGNFGSKKQINSSFQSVVSVTTVDIDNDGDQDVLSASFGDNKIHWFENTDGNGSFSTQKMITNNALGARAVFAADLDNDNYVDVLSASAFDNKIAWYKNLDGNGNFSSPKTISSSQTGARDVCAADLDNDNDMDVIAIGKDKICWFENSTNITSVKNNQTNIPNKFQLYQNYPNPFNPSTTIKYNLHKPGYVVLKIYNLSGEEVETLANGFQTAGEHEVNWQPEGFSSGIYFYQLKASEYTQTKKMLLLK